MRENGKVIIKRCRVEKLIGVGWYGKEEKHGKLNNILYYNIIKERKKKWRVEKG